MPEDGNGSFLIGMAAMDHVRGGGAALGTGSGEGTNRADEIAGEEDGYVDVDVDVHKEDGFDSGSSRRKARNGFLSRVGGMTHCDTVWSRIPWPPQQPVAHL